MLSIIGSILGVIVAGLIGIVTYAWQENRKMKTSLAEGRQNLYETLIRNLFQLLSAKSATDRSKFVSQIEKGWLFASDDVLFATYEFMEIYDSYFSKGDGGVLGKVRENHKIRQEFESSIAKILLAMRRDIKPYMRRPTEITYRWAKDHIRIYEWGILAKPD